MIRFLAIAILAATLLPTSAEARKFRFGGNRSSHADSDTSSTGGSGSSAVVVPRIGRSSKPGDAKAGQPTRPPFPTATASAPLRLTTVAAEPKVWCRSDVVVGGFCVVN